MKHKQDPALKGKKRQMIPMEIPMPPEMMGKVTPGAKAYKLGNCTIIWQIHPQTKQCHIVVMHQNRWPNYEEMRAVSKLAPTDAAMALLFPGGETPESMTGGKRVLSLTQIGQLQQHVPTAQLLTPQGVRNVPLQK